MNAGFDDPELRKMVAQEELLENVTFFISALKHEFGCSAKRSFKDPPSFQCVLGQMHGGRRGKLFDLEARDVSEQLHRPIHRRLFDRHEFAQCPDHWFNEIKI